jgi:hypothetical protein
MQCNAYIQSNIGKWSVQKNKNSALAIYQWCGHNIPLIRLLTSHWKLTLDLHRLSSFVIFIATENDDGLFRNKSASRRRLGPVIETGREPRPSGSPGSSGGTLRAVRWISWARRLTITWRVSGLLGFLACDWWCSDRLKLKMGLSLGHSVVGLGRWPERFSQIRLINYFGVTNLIVKLCLWLWLLLWLQ